MFTLLMLLFFEGMLCKQRQNSLLSLKNMRRPPRDLFTLRGGRWSMTSSDELVPGDIISLISNDTAPVVPCDGVLLSGSCVVNEAMLTGESVPQVKESLVNDSTGDALFDIGVEGNNEEASRWKKNLVLAGTSILQHSPESDSRALAAPDGGCRVLVLRTGFGTTQVTFPFISPLFLTY